MVSWEVDGDPGADVTAVILAAVAQARDEAPEIKSVVYYISFADRIKIGTSTQLPNRMQELPHDALLATEPGDWLMEAIRHAQFAEYRIKGEWFSRAQPLLDHISMLADAA
jgi:hypothetical protein